MCTLLRELITVRTENNPFLERWQELTPLGIKFVQGLSSVPGEFNPPIFVYEWLLSTETLTIVTVFRLTLKLPHC